MRGLELIRANERRKQTDIQTDRYPDRQTDGHGDFMTDSAQWGQFSENTYCNFQFFFYFFSMF